MQLFEHGLQLFGNGQTEVRRVLKERYSLVGQIEKDHRRPEYRAGANDPCVEYVSYPHEGEYQNFLEYALEAYRRAELLVDYRAHHARHVVDNDERDQRVKKTVAAAEEPSEPAPDGGEYHLNGDPEFLHFKILLLIFVSLSAIIPSERQVFSYG